MRVVRIAIVSVLLMLLAATTAVAGLHRTVTGPRTIVPGHLYTFRVSGFRAGERIYPTVQPAACLRSSDRCEQSPCPSCAPARVSRSGTATVRFRWPARSLYVVANMDFRHPSWRRHSTAVVRIDLVSLALSVPSGCRRTKSLTANPRAGSIVCAVTDTVVR